MYNWMQKQFDKHRAKREKGEAGFTLIELVVVIAIMGILAGVGTVGYSAYSTMSAKKSDIALVGKINQVLNHGHYVFNVDGVEQLSSEGIQFPVGFIVLSNETLNPGNENEGTVVVMESGENSTALNDLMTAAYGSDYNTSLKLLYDGWTTSSIPTFFEGSGAMVEKVQTLGGLLLRFVDDGTNFKINLGLVKFDIPVTAESHENEADLFIDFAEKVTQKTNTTKDAAQKKKEFLDNWNSAAGNPEDTGTNYESNGLGVGGREYYSAMRSSYNNSFASYVTQQGGTHTGENHADKIANYGKGAGTVLLEEAGNRIPSYLQGAAEGFVNGIAGEDAKFPQLICWSAFNNENSGLDSDVQNCDRCRELYQSYIEDGVCESNGAAFYDTMITAATAGREYYDNNGKNSNQFFTWMNDATEDFSAMYQDVKNVTNGKSSIVMSVYYGNGMITTEVSPSNADPNYED